MTPFATWHKDTERPGPLESTDTRSSAMRKARTWLRLLALALVSFDVWYMYTCWLRPHPDNPNCSGGTVRTVRLGGLATGAAERPFPHIHVVLTAIFDSPKLLHMSSYRGAHFLSLLGDIEHFTLNATAADIERVARHDVGSRKNGAVGPHAGDANSRSGRRYSAL